MTGHLTLVHDAEPCDCERILVAFTIPTRPVPKGRPRVVGSHTYTDERTVTYEATVATYATRAMRGRAPIDAPVKVLALFEQTDRRPADVDNLVKSLLDGMSGKRSSKGHAGRLGPVIANDSQVVELHARIVRGADRDGVSVAVLAMREDR